MCFKEYRDNEEKEGGWASLGRFGFVTAADGRYDSLIDGKVGILYK